LVFLNALMAADRRLASTLQPLIALCLDGCPATQPAPVRAAVRGLPFTLSLTAGIVQLQPSASFSDYSPWALIIEHELSGHEKVHARVYGFIEGFLGFRAVRVKNLTLKP
jgi:hypothetical protein